MRVLVTQSFILLILVLFTSSCVKPALIPPYGNEEYSTNELAILYSNSSDLLIERIDRKTMPPRSFFQNNHYQITPELHEVSYRVNETIPAETYCDPVSGATIVIVPEVYLTNTGTLWVDAREGESLVLRSRGTPPHENVWVEDAESGRIVSGQKSLSFWRHDFERRRCDESGCQPVIVESEWLDSKTQECRLIEYKTGEVLRRCRGQEECSGMGLCYE